MTAVREFGDAARSRGLHLGDGLFETVLVASGRSCFLAEHVARMRASGAALGVAVPGDVEDVVLRELPAMWGEVGRPARSALRITVTRGSWEGLAADGATEPSWFLALRALPPSVAGSTTAVTIDAPRIDPASPLAGHKVISWMDKVEARRRAVAAGFETALLRTVDGDVAEADSANLFVVVGGTVVTPPLSRGVLPGVTRARALAALRRAARPVRESAISVGDLDAADEAFVTSSLSGIVPLRRIGVRALPAPGPVTAWLGGCVPPDRESDLPGQG